MMFSLSEIRSNFEYSVYLLDKTGMELDLANFNNRDFLFMSETFSNDTRRNEWLWGRCCLKQLLNSQTGIKTSHIFVSRNQHGRPVVEEPTSLLEIDVSLSHKPPYYFAGFAKGAHIGVDIDHIQSIEKTESLLRFFSAHEKTAIDSFDSEMRARHIMIRWCLKEAALKACQGTSIVQLKDYCFDVSEIDAGEFNGVPVSQSSFLLKEARCFERNGVFMSVVIA